MEAWDEGVVYLKTTTKEGGETFTSHRCWHRGRFVAAARETALKEGGWVLPVSREEFKREGGR